MAYSHVTYTGDGTNTIFNIPFPFLKREFITVNINGVKQPPEDMEWLNDTSIRVAKAPPAGSSVMIFRDTAKDKAVVDFRDGSILTERALDDQIAQLLHITQEVYDVPGQLESTLEGIESTAHEAAEQAKLAGEQVLLAQEEADRAKAEAVKAAGIIEEGLQSVGTARDSAVQDVVATRDSSVEAVQAEGNVQVERAQSEADRAKEEADRATDMVNVGPATSDKLGMVKIGEGIAVDSYGTISVTPINPASRSSAGIVQIGEGLNITDASESSGEGEDSSTTSPGILSLGAHHSEDYELYGKGNFQFFGHVKLTDNFEEETSAKDGVGISAAGVKAAWDRLVGAGTETIITTSGSWVVPETGQYALTCVGGGGNGGASGLSVKGQIYGGSNNWYWGCGGGGGGGGGAGQTVTKTVSLTKGTSIQVVVGGAGGSTSFGSHATAIGGGHGGAGGAGGGGVAINGGVTSTFMYNTSGGSGGAAGTSYGSSSSNGGNGASVSGNFASAYGGGGGAGGISHEGTYGNGGRGADAPTRISPGNNVAGGVSYGWGGAPGIQGCVKIRLAIGG